MLCENEREKGGFGAAAAAVYIYIYHSLADYFLVGGNMYILDFCEVR